MRDLLIFQLKLADIGVKPFLVSAAVQAVIAQRLVRRLCQECKQEYTPAEGEFEALGLDPRLLAGRRFFRARACRACSQLPRRSSSSRGAIVSSMSACAPPSMPPAP